MSYKCKSCHHEFKSSRYLLKEGAVCWDHVYCQIRCNLNKAKNIKNKGETDPVVFARLIEDLEYMLED